MNFAFGLSPFPIPVLRSVTSEDPRFPFLNAFDYARPSRGWRSTAIGVTQDIQLDWGVAGVAGIHLSRTNFSEIVIERCTPSFGAFGPAGPNVLGFSNRPRRTAGVGSPESPWFASGFLGVNTTVSTNLPYLDWGYETTFVTTLGTDYIGQTISFGGAVANEVARLSLWYRVEPGVAFPVNTQLRILGGSSTAQLTTTLRDYDWHRVETSLSIGATSNTTVAFHILTSAQIRIANVQANVGMSTPPTADYITGQYGYLIPTHPHTGRRSLFLQMGDSGEAWARYQRWRVPGALATDDGAGAYVIGSAVGMTEWFTFPGKRQLPYGMSVITPVSQRDFPSGAKEFLALGDRRMLVDLDPGVHLTRVIRSALQRLIAQGVMKPIFFWENLPEPADVLGSVGVRDALFGNPASAIIARRSGDIRVSIQGVPDLQSLPLAFEEVV